MKRIQSQTLQVKPCLAIIHANDRPDSLAYINRKIKAIERLGFLYQYYKFNSDQLDNVTARIQKLNQDTAVHGIMIQSPLYESSGVSFDDLVAHITPQKDVDGLKPSSPYTSCTALAVMEILQFYDISLRQQRVLVVGRSKTVGDPIARLLREYGGDVSVTHSGTDRSVFIELVQQADIIVSAAGVPGVIEGALVKNEAVLVDVGISIVDGGRVLGDIQHGRDRDAGQIRPTTHYRYTPVPGGVGPVTVAMLMQNVALAAGTPTAH